MTSGGPRLRVAVVGCGKIADGHVEQIRCSGIADVVAVCDHEPLMARQLSMRMGVPRCYEDLGRMLEIERPDVVHIATPPDSHVRLAEQCFAAGCHVFMEKPFALDEQQTRLVLALAKSADRKVCVNLLYNFETPYLKMLGQVRAGELGEIVHVEILYGYNLAGDYGLSVLADPGHWVHRLPGKLFHNLLDHVVSKAVPFFPADRIEAQALAHRRRPGSGVAALDAMADELRFTVRVGGLTVGGMISAHARPAQHAMRVYGTKASVVVDIGARTIVPVVAPTLPSALGRLVPSWSTARAYRRNAWENLRQFRRSEFHYFQGMRVLLREFYGAVLQRNNDPISPQFIERTATAIDAVIAAAGGDTGGSSGPSP